MRKKVGNPPLRMMMTTSIKRATVAFRDGFRAQAIKNAKKCEEIISAFQPQKTLFVFLKMINSSPMEKYGFFGTCNTLF